MKTMILTAKGTAPCVVYARTLREATRIAVSAGQSSGRAWVVADEAGREVATGKAVPRPEFWPAAGKTAEDLDRRLARQRHPR